MTEPEALPEHIGPYRVTGRLGRGGMGEVLRGHDDRLDRPVALKRVRPGGRDPEKARQRFRREARVVAQLSHQAIVPVYDWVEADDHDWLVMERVDGRSLDEVLADGPLPPERAAAIAREVASGLAAAHAAGLVHRDLKPANVMVTAGGDLPARVKILDFGIAKQVGLEAGAGPEDQLTTFTEAGQVVGTVTSMSPEQALGYPVDHRSDLFALGTLLYEMLAGVSPFQGDTAVETLSRICSARETPLSDLDPQVPEGLANLVGRLLEKEPARRPADARQVVAELDRLAAASSGSDAAGVASPAAAGTSEQDETLVAGDRGVSRSVADSEKRAGVVEESGNYSTRKISGKRVLLAATGVLIAVGLWGLSSWLRTSGGKEPAVDGSPVAVGMPREAAMLSSHELYQRGMALLERYDRKGNINKAIADFQRALAEDESSASAHAGLARAYWLDLFRGSKDPQRREQALAAARRAVELGEYLAVARVSLGMVYFEMGRTEDAVRELEHALQLEPLNADAWYGLGRVDEAHGQLVEAEKHYQRAIEARPDYWGFHSRLGTLYFRAGRYEEAEAAFQSSLDLTPDNFVDFRNLGAVYYMQGKLNEAATEFQHALEIQPEPTIYTNLGIIYFTQGLYSQSLSAFEKAMNSGGGPNDYQLWANLGDAYRWTPDNEPRANEAFMRAIQLLREKLATAPEDTTLRTRQALYLAKSGDCDQALANVDGITDLAASDASAWYRLVGANEICGRRDHALAALSAALQAGLAILEIQRDPELLQLRQDVRYHRLVMKLQQDGGV